MCAPDPQSIDWKQIELPNTWPDTLKLWRFQDIKRLWKRVLGKRHRITLPPELPGLSSLPAYLLQEFHHLPNGNYSNHIAQGYTKGFDIAMLGKMKQARRQIAKSLLHCHSVLDVGCGGGKLAGTLKALNIPDVWGLDPSPYLLKSAANRYPRIRFIQGIAENLPFSTERFDGIGVCFLFHELPKTIATESLQEFYRVLKPQGTLAILEPAPEQFYETRFWELYRLGGLAGIYFSWLAQAVFEPYVLQWHRCEVKRLLEQSGFSLLSDKRKIPFRFMVAQKRRP
ncbi:MAG: class I SAM-dependent methyltransferase [Planctomycetota bacterium]